METTQLFDKVFKRVIRLSSHSVVRFINGLFNKDYPIDSRVTYYSTENIKDNLGKDMSDSIVVINDKDKFLIESQTSDDKTMVVRVFDYSFYDAIKYKEITKDKIVLKFANPKVIYFQHTNSTPDELILEIVFEHQENFTFKVPTMKFLNYEIEDIIKNNMIILIPLYLLKLRKEIDKHKTVENAKKLQDLIDNGIVSAIEENKQLGNITPEDARILIDLVGRIYREIYGDINLFKEEGVAKMLEERLILETDIAEERGIEKGIKQMTLRMLKMNMPITDISNITQLTIEEIEKLKLELE